MCALFTLGRAAPSTSYWLFTGEQQDHASGDTGYYFLRARYYDPTLGRFISRDPLLFEQRYEYAGSNPSLLVDPSGACFVCDLGGLVVDVAQAVVVDSFTFDGCVAGLAAGGVGLIPGCLLGYAAGTAIINKNPVKLADAAADLVQVLKDCQDGFDACFDAATQALLIQLLKDLNIAVVDDILAPCDEYDQVECGPLKSGW